MSELSPNTIELIKQRHFKQLDVARKILDAIGMDVAFVLGENVIPKKVEEYLDRAYMLISQYQVFLQTGEVWE